MKPLPIGVDLFENIVSKNYFYIDKTLFIKEVLALQNEVTLITRPRRFGKTLNMSMLKCFFDVTQKKQNLFDGFQIMRYGDIVEKYKNKYPVIFVTLKGVKEPTFADSMEMLKDLMAKLYRQNQYLYDSDALSRYQKEDFEKFLSKKATVTELKNALEKLTEYLYAYHNKKVIILIDEYDAPIDNAEMEGFYPDMIKFMRGFFGSSLKTNEYLEFGIVTGVQRIAKEGLFSDLNNPRIYTVLDDKYADYFGFTEEEVVAACKMYDTEDSIEEIKTFYNGYHFGQKEIYNPWSILNYLDEKRLGNYWVNTGSTAILQNIFSKGDIVLKNAVEGLLLDIPVTMQFASHITYPIKYESTDSFWTLLLNAGYIKPQNNTPVNPDERFSAQLVNLEVKRAFRICIGHWFSEQKGYFSQGLHTFIQALLTGDSNGMQAALNTKLLISASYHDMVAENSFHMFILGILQTLGDEYIIRSNREEGDGRADCTIRPKDDKTKAAAVMEFKHVKGDATQDQIKSEAKEALNQINNKGYIREMRDEGYINILKYGIAFNGKNCIVIAGN